MENNFKKISGNINVDTDVKIRRRKWWIFAPMVFVVALLLAWNLYLSPDAKKFHAERKNYETAMNTIATYENAMKNDTYGGKTPQETVNLFVQALKNSDLQLASNYFTLKSTSTSNEWYKILENAEIKGELNEIILALSSKDFEFNNTISEHSSFIFKNEKNEVLLIIDLILNKYSGVWKIESL